MVKADELQPPGVDVVECVHKVAGMRLEQDFRTFGDVASPIDALDGRLVPGCDPAYLDVRLSRGVADDLVEERPCHLHHRRRATTAAALPGRPPPGRSLSTRAEC